MKQRAFYTRTRRRLFCLMLCAALLTLSACSNTADTAVATPTVADATHALLHATVSPAPTLENDPAILYTSVITDQRVISLILEGYTDDGTMSAMLDALKAESIPAQFFISGIVADEHPGTVQAIAEKGFTIGNYGLSAEKNMQDNDVLENIHQFQRGQELIEKATGQTPTLFRCNGTEYTREVLQAAASVGLTAGVKPNVFLNHASFSGYDNALLFVQKLARGSIISIKLGQVLDSDEYEGITYNMDNLAIDPGPMLSDRMEDTVAATYANIVNVIGWLLQALNEEGYVVLTPEALQAERITMFDNPIALDSQTLAMLDPSQYALPVTLNPLSNIEPLETVSVPDALSSAGLATPAAAENTPDATEADAENTSPDATPAGSSDYYQGVVLIGDSVTMGLQDYVSWRRETSPGYMGQVRFLTSSDFSIGMSEMRVSDTSVHPKLDGVKYTVEEALKRMDAKTALLMPGQADVRGYTPEKFIENVKLMIYQIYKANPGIKLWLESIPPGVAERYTKPDNTKLFTYNLALYQLCLQFDIPFLDVAYTLRDDQGNLPDNLCLDVETYGIHLNDSGCEKWIQFLRGYLPD